MQKSVGAALRTRAWFLSAGNQYVVETDGLLIKNVAQEDAGTYTCRARVLETGSLEERDIKLEVRAKTKVGADSREARK